jgi:hypothetical protein
MFKKILLHTLLLAANICVFAQATNNNNLEHAKLLIETAKYKEAKTILVELQKKDKKNNAVLFELAYCNYHLGFFNEVINNLTLLKEENYTSPLHYQMLGNSQDNEFKRAEAKNTLKIGIEKFPNAGELYYEIGVINLAEKKLDIALNYFEKGIMQDDNYAGNYYWAAKLFSNSNNKYWALIYGEQFMLLEPSTKRSKEICNLLIALYNKCISLTGNGNVDVMFFDIENNNKYASKESTFESTCLLLNYSFAASKLDNFNTIQDLYTLRNLFIENIIELKQDNLYQNSLFDYWKKLKANNLWQAYNYWLFQEKSATEVLAYVKQNQQDWQKFITYLSSENLSGKSLHRLTYP